MSKRLGNIQTLSRIQVWFAQAFQVVLKVEVALLTLRLNQNRLTEKSD